MNQEPLTTLRNRSSQKNGHADIVDLFCNAEVRFPVLSRDGSCLEGVHARDVDFLRDRNRRSFHCIACRNGRSWLPGGRTNGIVRPKFQACFLID